MRELCRVAGRVFISVPNRYFPVEHHTAIPLLHFWDKGFELACKWLGKADWADERNLILMSWPSLAALTPGGRPGHRPHRHQARTVQLQPISLHRCRKPAVVDPGHGLLGAGYGVCPSGRPIVRPVLPGGPSSPCGARAPSYMSQDAALAAKL